MPSSFRSTITVLYLQDDFFLFIDRYMTSLNSKLKSVLQGIRQEKNDAEL
jgi:hypothetical protein